MQVPEAGESRPTRFDPLTPVPCVVLVTFRLPTRSGSRKVVHAWLAYNSPHNQGCFPLLVAQTHTCIVHLLSCRTGSNLLQGCSAAKGLGVPICRVLLLMQWCGYISVTCIQTACLGAIVYAYLLHLIQRCELASSLLTPPWCFQPSLLSL